MDFKNFCIQPRTNLLTLGALLIVTLLSGCERINDIVSSPPDPVLQPTLKIGMIQPRDHYVTFGRGVQLAQAQLNARGGVMGMQIEFIQKDNQNCPEHIS